MGYKIVLRDYDGLTRSEIEQMHDIELSCIADPTPIVSSFREFETLLKKSVVIFLLKIDGNVSGYATLEQEDHNIWYLQNLVVAKRFRGFGWGKVLIKLRNDYAIKRGAITLYRHAGVENIGVQLMYEKTGFTIKETLQDHYGVGKHGILMSKSIKEDR